MPAHSSQYKPVAFLICLSMACAPLVLTTMWVCGYVNRLMSPDGQVVTILKSRYHYENV